MPGNDNADMKDVANTGTISVLERFRQLSREKENQRSASSSGSQRPVAAVYLNNGNEKPDDKQKYSRDCVREQGNKKCSYCFMYLRWVILNTCVTTYPPRFKCSIFQSALL